MQWVPREVHPEAKAIWSHGRWHTYRDLAQRSSSIAALVRARVPDQSSIIPVIGENSFALAAGYLGVLSAGRIPALVPELSDAAMQSVLADVETNFALVDPTQLDRIRGLGASRALPLDLALEPDAEVACEDREGRALVIFTSGSTNTPRGVVQSARNLRFNAEAILDATAIASDERSLITLPLHYCYGLSVLHTHLARGAAVVFARPSSIAGELLELIDETAPTGLPAVPSLVQTLMRDAAAHARLASLRYVMISGGRLADHDLERLIEIAPRTRIHVRYGITETTAAASFLPPERLRDKLGSIGRGLRDAPLHVIGDSGTPVVPGSGEVGEIHVRGDHVALGYLHGDAGGFVDGGYKTGDRAIVDADGFVFVVGRTQAFVKSGGHRISVEEIEATLGRFPGLESAAVCGVPHPARGEALIAVVVPLPGHSLSPTELRAHCAKSLPSFKVPVEFRVAPSLPLTANGKIDRRALAALVRETR